MSMDDAYKDAGKDFSIFVTGLSMQTLVSMGEIPNPLNDNKKEKNLDQARYMIDTLDMIKEKTKGNLKPDEEKLLEGILYELRMKYLDLTRKEESSC
ncbi:MAG: DUF1844 domain-containing protein [Candidatus Omnitrophota bacterium]